MAPKIDPKTAHLSDADKSQHPVARFDVLDGLRGVAAFFVVFRHFPGAELRHPWPLSFLAVDFFFILSGFVLAPGLSKIKKPAEVLRYMIERAIRVWPTYLLGAAVAIGAQCWSPQEIDRSAILAQIPGTLVLLPLIKGPASLLFPLVGPAWSLFAEFWIANLLFSIVYAKLGRPGIAVVALASAGFMCALTISHGNADFGFTWRSLPATFVRVILSFSIGCLLRSFRRSTLGNLPTAFGPILAIDLAFIFWLPLAYSAVFQILVILVVLPAIVWVGSQVRFSPSTRAVGRVLGESSYPLYALHAGLGMLVSNTMGAFRFNFPHSTIVFAILFVPISWFVATFYDRPLRIWIKKVIWAGIKAPAPRSNCSELATYAISITHNGKERGAA
jgi:peptidoglycan/LPS O-acetylase OafA/YrhL